MVIVPTTPGASGLLLYDLENNLVGRVIYYDSLNRKAVQVDDAGLNPQVIDIRRIDHMGLQGEITPRVL